MSEEAKSPPGASSGRILSPWIPFHGHIVGQPMTGAARRAVERLDFGRVGAVLRLLPFRPQAIDIAVQQKKERILHGGFNHGEETLKLVWIRLWGVAFHHPEVGEKRAQGERLHFVAARGRVSALLADNP